MSETLENLPGFKAVFTTIGVVYVVLASSMVARGAGVLRDFGVPEAVVSSPVLADFFSFFYLLMAFLGVLTVVLGHATQGRRRQMVVSSIFAAWNLVAALRDLSTSDSRFGSRIYEGEATLVFVVIDLAFALAFASLVLVGALRKPKTAAPTA